MNHERRELNLPLSAALTVGMTVGATAVANMERSPEEVREAITSVMHHEPGSHVALGIDWHGLSLPGAHLETSKTDVRTMAGPSQTVHMTSTVPLYRSWALKFSADPEATKPLGNEELVSIDESVAYINELGGRVTDAEVVGHASDESHISITENGTNPGLGAHNAENVDLANTRAKAALPIVRRTLQQNGYNVPVAMGQGKEDVDPALEAKIKKVAAHLGMSATDLVMKYNLNEQSVPADAREVLNGLKPGRRVDLLIHSEQEIALPESVQTEHDADALLIPVPIPIFRRNREEQKLDVEETPEPIAEPIEEVPLAPVITEVKPTNNYPKAGMPNVRTLTTRYATTTARTRKQPREYNMGKNNAQHSHRGRASRSKGGNRSGKRA